jgi:ribonuclease R
MGDKVYIRVVAANLTKRQLDFEWILKPEMDDQLEEENQSEGKKKGKGKGGRKKK